MLQIGRPYVAPMVAVVNDLDEEDLWEVNAPSDAIVLVERFAIGQVTLDQLTTESVLARLDVLRATTSGSGGASITPEPLLPGDAAYGGSVETGNDTVAAGTTTFLDTRIINMLAGKEEILTPSTPWVIPPSGRLAIRLNNGTGINIQFYGTLWLREIG